MEEPSDAKLRPNRAKSRIAGECVELAPAFESASCSAAGWPPKISWNDCVASQFESEPEQNSLSRRPLRGTGRFAMREAREPPPARQLRSTASVHPPGA